MDSQLGTNMVTWFVILPILLIIAAVIIGAIIKANLSPLKRLGLIVMGLFAWIGFAMVLLGVYYQTNDAFAASFKFYAYSALAPGSDPFQIAEGNYGPLIMKIDMYKENGLLRILKTPSPNFDYGGYVFIPDGYGFVRVNDDGLLVLTSVDESESVIAKTSLWWALTMDLTRLNVTAE